VVAKHVEVPHADLTEVTGMVWSMLLAGVTKRNSCRLEHVAKLEIPRSLLRHVQAALGCWLRTLIDVGAVVVLFVELAHVPRIRNRQSSYLTTGHTTTTRVLSVLADTTGRVLRQYGFDGIGRFVVTYPLPADTWRTRVSISATTAGRSGNVHGRGAFLSWKTG
jgi:hypothetical protein